MEPLDLIAALDIAGLYAWVRDDVLWRLARYADRRLVPAIENVFLAPMTWCVMLGILVLERCLPARPAQRTLSIGFLQDTLYFGCTLVVSALVITLWVQILRGVYLDYLAFLTITPLQSLPDTARFALAILVSDFIFWLHHYVKHAVPWFWEFHAVHHAQRELNLFTDERYHFMEYVIEQVFNVFLLSMFTVNGVYIVAFQIGRKWYTRLYHSNVRTNLGPLRYVFVTPQSHRVHHSIEVRHRDKNFGVLFSFWDRIFGTQYAGYDEYPATGVADPSFPHPAPGRGVLRTLAAQHVHPFARIARSIRDQVRTPSPAHSASRPDSKHSPV